MSATENILTFPDFLREKLGTNWVVGRRCPRIVSQYGPDVICLSPKRYDALRAEYERTSQRGADSGSPQALIDAAPDMLATLEAVFNWHATPKRLRSPEHVIWTRVRTTIAQARGERFRDAAEARQLARRAI